MKKTVSFRKLKALCGKDIVDYFKNPSILVMFIMPILLVTLYKFMRVPEDAFGEEELGMAYLLLVLGSVINCSMCGLLVASTSIAEEKEKLTMRTLILSNVSGLEFLLAKVTAGLLMTFLGNVVIFFMTGTPVRHLPIFLAATTLGAVSLNLISAVIGLFSRDQMSCGVLQIPVLLVFLLPAVLGGHLSGAVGNVMQAVGKFVPTNAMVQVFSCVMTGKTEQLLFYFGTLLAWIAVAVAAFVLIYRKKRLDN